MSSPPSAAISKYSTTPPYLLYNRRKQIKRRFFLRPSPNLPPGLVINVSLSLFSNVSAFLCLSPTNNQKISLSFSCLCVSARLPNKAHLQSKICLSFFSGLLSLCPTPRSFILYYGLFRLSPSLVINVPIITVINVSLLFPAFAQLVINVSLSQRPNHQRHCLGKL